MAALDGRPSFDGCSPQPAARAFPARSARPVSDRTQSNPAKYVPTMTLRRTIANLSFLGLCGVVAPCLAFAVNPPSGEPLEHVDTTFLGMETGPAAPAPGWAIQVGAF